MEKRYIKGFEVDYQKVAEKIAMVTDTSDPKVTAAVHGVIKYFDREAYKYVGLGCVNRPDERLAMVIVLAVGNDRTELEKKELGPIDETIQAALPHVLDGPHVWEEWR
jgi:hypothetical protein